MKDLLPHAEKVAAMLKARNQTIAVAESSTGGLLAAALLGVAGASAYFHGGAVLYTRNALLKLVNVEEERLRGMQPSSEPYALLKAQLIRQHLSATWGIAETGAAGPTGSRYGYAAGHSCMAVSGPVERVHTIETGSNDRVANMYAFATAALGLLARALEESRPGDTTPPA